MTDTAATSPESDDAQDWMPSKEEVAQVLSTTARNFSHEQLAGVKSFKDAIALANSTFGEVRKAEDVLGDGFIILENKSKLVNVPFVMLDWEEGKNVTKGDGFVICRVVTEADHKLIITDGGSGIRRQLLDMRELTPEWTPIYFMNGLRVSEYGLTADNQAVDLNDPSAKSIAQTFYLSA